MSIPESRCRPDEGHVGYEVRCWWWWQQVLVEWRWCWQQALALWRLWWQQAIRPMAFKESEFRWYGFHGV